MTGLARVRDADLAWRSIDLVETVDQPSAARMDHEWVSAPGEDQRARHGDRRNRRRDGTHVTGFGKISDIEVIGNPARLGTLDVSMVE